MKENNTLLHKLKPGVPKRALMLIAGIIWSIPSTILLNKGITWLYEESSMFYLLLPLSFIFGLLFYHFLFKKISSKHIKRIREIKHERPCMFSFFNWKGYVMMGGMILFGFSLRSFEIIPIKYMSIIYITMGTPLSISALRFFYSWVKY